MDDCKAYGKGAGHWCDCGEVDFQELQAQLAEAQAYAAALGEAYDAVLPEQQWRRGIDAVLNHRPAAVKEIQERLAAAEKRGKCCFKECGEPAVIGGLGPSYADGDVLPLCEAHVKRALRVNAEGAQRGERLREWLQVLFDRAGSWPYSHGGENFINPHEEKELEALLKGEQS